MYQESQDWDPEQRTNALKLGIGALMIGSYGFARLQGIPHEYALFVALGTFISRAVPTAATYLFVRMMSDELEKGRKTATISALLMMSLGAPQEAFNGIHAAKEIIFEEELKRKELLEEASPVQNDFKDNSNSFETINNDPQAFILTPTTAKLALG